MTAHSPEDLNVLYDAALEFGENFRRPVVELAAERLPLLPTDVRSELADLVERTRTEVELHIEGEYARYGDAWPDEAKVAVHDWITDQYPWMDERNVSHAISQGVYFAWHG
jgi:hypothetical protein